MPESLSKLVEIKIWGFNKKITGKSYILSRVYEFLKIETECFVKNYGAPDEKIKKPAP